MLVSRSFVVAYKERDTQHCDARVRRSQASHKPSKNASPVTFPRLDLVFRANHDGLTCKAAVTYGGNVTVGMYNLDTRGFIHRFRLYINAFNVGTAYL